MLSGSEQFRLLLKSIHAGKGLHDTLAITQPCCTPYQVPTATLYYLEGLIKYCCYTTVLTPNAIYSVSLNSALHYPTANKHADARTN
jgi:hypothetical protein